MNGIDAILAICALTAGIGVLLGAVSEVKNNFDDANDKIEAKTNSLICAGIIDSIAANGANEYQGKLNCDTNNGKINSRVNKSEKNAQTIARTKKSRILEVEINPHYTD